MSRLDCCNPCRIFARICIYWSFPPSLWVAPSHPNAHLLCASVPICRDVGLLISVTSNNANGSTYCHLMGYYHWWGEELQTLFGYSYSHLYLIMLIFMLFLVMFITINFFWVVNQYNYGKTYITISSIIVITLLNYYCYDNNGYLMSYYLLSCFVLAFTLYHHAVQSTRLGGRNVNSTGGSKSSSL